MATSVADLAINVSANIAQAVEGMSRLGRSVDGAADRIFNLQSVAKDFARSFATTLAGAFSVGAISSMVSSVVDAAASLDDLTEKTGASVETLSKFAGVARITGQDLGAVESSMNKLSKSLAEAQDGGSQAAKAFGAFGINIRDASGNLKNSGEIMEDLARKQQNFGDGAGKSAAMMQLLGRSGAELIPFLNDYVRLSGEVSETTTEQARQAEDLNIQIGLMQERFNKLARDAILPLIPQIRDLITSFESLGRTIANLSPSSRGPLEGFLESIRETNRETVGEIAYFKTQFQNLQRWWDNDVPLAKMLRGDIRGGLSDFFGNRSGGITGAIDPSAASGAAKLAVSNEELAKAARELPPLMEATSTAAAKVGVQFNAASKGVDVFGRSLQAMQKVLRQAESDAANLGRAAGDQLAPSMQRLADVMASPEWAKFSERQKGEITRLAENAAGVYRLVEAYKAQQNVQAELVRIRERTSAIEQRALETLNNYTDGLAQQLEALRREGEEIGRTEGQLAALTLRRIDDTIRAKEQVLAAYQNVEGAEAYSAALEAQINLLQRIRTETASNQSSRAFVAQAEEARRTWVSALEDITAAGAGFLEDLLHNGSDAFENLWENFKRWAIAAFAKIAAQRVVVSLVGSFGASGAANAGGALGGLGDIGNLFGLGGSGGGGGLLGGGMLAGIGDAIFGGGGAAAFGAGFASPFATLGGVGSTLLSGASFAAPMMALASTIGAAIPIIGIGLAIASALGAFDQSVPKTGGSGGRAVNLESGTEWDLARRMFGPNDNDAAVQKLVNSIATDFGKIASSFGVNTGQFGFHLGYDAHEEHGNRVSSLVTDALGGTIYEAKDVSVGDDPAAIQEALGLEAQRALLAALQASEMPQYLADVFDSITVADASAEAIQGVIEFASGLKIAVEAVKGLGGQFAELEPEVIKQFVEELGGLDNLVASFQFVGDNFTTNADKIANASNFLSQSFEQLGLEVPASHEALKDLLGSFDLSTEAGRAAYISVLNLSQAFVAVNGTAQEAANKITEWNNRMAGWEGFIGQNFYSSADRAAKATADLNRIVGDLGLTVPQTHAEFLNMLNGFDRTTEAGRNMYLIFVRDVAPAFVAVHGSADAAAQAVKNFSNAIGAGTIANQARQIFDGIKDRMESLAGAVDGSLGDQLTVRLSATQNEIERVSASMYALFQQGFGGTSEHIKLGDVLRKLNEYQAGTAATLARFTVLTAQFDAQRAGELVDLEAWYAEQREIFNGNSAALEALNKIFGDKWKAIVEGVSTGVGGTINELERLRENLAKWLQGLTVGDLSPMKPLERLDQARLQFEEQFGAASTGDTQALGDISKYADQYLRLARDLYKSSETYTDIFDFVTTMIAQLAGTDAKGMPLGDNFAPEMMPITESLASALPANGARLASADDMRAAGVATAESITAAIAALADANSADTEELRAELASLRRTMDAKFELLK